MKKIESFFAKGNEDKKKVFKKTPDDIQKKMEEKYGKYIHEKGVKKNQEEKPFKKPKGPDTGQAENARKKEDTYYTKLDVRGPDVKIKRGKATVEKKIYRTKEQY